MAAGAGEVLEVARGGAAGDVEGEAVGGVAEGWGAGEFEAVEGFEVVGVEAVADY